jgi:hypothetical protein
MTEKEEKSVYKNKDYRLIRHFLGCFNDHEMIYSKVIYQALM